MSDDQAISLLKQATAAHKKGDLAVAESKYRQALELTRNESPKVLLASVLLSTAHTKSNVIASRAESLQLARDAISSAGLSQPSAGSAAVPDSLAGASSVQCAGTPAGSSLGPAQQALLRTRYGYFLLQYAGYVRAEGRPMEEPLDLTPTQRQAMLREAIEHLEAAAEVAAKPDPLVWRNLSLAYTACERLGDAERASAMCVVCAGGVARGSAPHTAAPSIKSMEDDRAPWDLHYKHAKALKRVGREIEALEKYCDAVEASVRDRQQPSSATTAPEANEMPLFWLRVAEAGGVKGDVPANLRARVRELLSRYGQTTVSIGKALADSTGTGAQDSTAGNDASGSAAAAARATAVVPHEYIRKLFDGYSKNFDEHLVQGLRYETPTKLLQLLTRTLQALAVLTGSPVATDAAEPVPTKPSQELCERVQSLLQGVDSQGMVHPWARCADLGCGTGLAGVAFRPLVRFLAGSDLSPGMIAEAAKRVYGADSPLYDVLEAGEIAAWMEGQVQAWTAPPPVLTATSGQGHPRHSRQPCFDLILAADVLVYIGDLAPVMSTCAKAMDAMDGADAMDGLSPSVPRYFIFSTESLEAAMGADHPAAAADGAGFVLTGTGRCVHSRAYVHRLARTFGFVPVCAQGSVIRQNAGKDVMGDLYILEYRRR